MNTLRLGSKGEDVKALQKILGISVDGIFGTNTQTAVKKFLSEHKLTVDGIVGPKTWQLLSNTNSNKTVSGITYNPLNVHITKYNNRDIKYIVIHYTGSGNSKSGRANSTKKTFETRSASADFCIDDDNIVQFNPDIKNYYCWHCGDKKYPNTKGATFYGKCTNRNSIGIEICSTNTGTFNSANHTGWSYTDKVLNNAEKLVKLLMKEYNIPIDRVIRHYDVSGKLCPGIIGWNDADLSDSKTGKKITGTNNSSEWIKFKQRLCK